ncbi:PDZ domain protein [Verrucomicrobiia bacterium DG1235]|nr:PDZ domain protein [Verrucomicrobiae bacterium DG1235]
MIACFSPHSHGNGNEGHNQLVQIEDQLVRLYQQYKDAVVKVKVAAKTQDSNGKEQVALTVLSGFYIDEKGTVLTNAVPLQEGPRIRIEKDGMQLLAVPIASDPRSNLGLVQVAKPPAGIRFINLDQVAKAPAIGSLAYAITSPLDFNPTPKLGLVTGRESSFSDIDFPFTYTRISIPSGPAEGGSPVFSSEGELIGISVASLPDINSSYLVPTNSLRHIVSQLRETKSFIHPIIRARFSEKTDPTSLSRSIVVNEVDEGSAASQSGLKAGDQIIQFEGVDVTQINTLRDAIFFSDADSFTSFIIRRGDEEMEITLLLESE